MKANEVPEKIYLEWYCVGDKKYRDWVITPKTNDEPIQYIRTDAFIKKAADWLNNFYNEDTHSYLIDEDIEKFINYMKGE